MKKNISIEFIKACKNLDFKLIKKYILQGANIHVSDEKGDIGLYYVLEKYPTSNFILKFLIEKGANINSKDSNSCTALHKAAENNDIELVKFLLDKKANINAYDCNGWTPIMSACEHDNFEIIKLLVEAGADLSCKDEDGDTVIDHACIRQDIIEYLMSHGAKSGHNEYCIIWWRV